jgi:hypothetical protein
MNLSEAAANRELLARVADLEMKVASYDFAITDLKRRMDDMSKAGRLLADDVEKATRTLSLKKANG